MGWGLGDFFDQVADWFGGQAEEQGGDILDDEANQRLLTRIIVESWTESLNPGELPDMIAYTGGAFAPDRVGWPTSIGVEALGQPGSLPEGTFFIGHASQGMIFESLRMTQGGVPLELDYEQRAGFVARLIQKDPNGDVIYIDGFEIGVERESGRIVREDLRLPAKSPLTAESRYGGPIEPFWPLYIDISSYGDFGGVTGIDDLQVQVTATFLCQEPSTTTYAQRDRLDAAATAADPSPYTINAPF